MDVVTYRGDRRWVACVPPQSLLWLQIMPNRREGHPYTQQGQNGARAVTSLSAGPTLTNESRAVTRNVIPDREASVLEGPRRRGPSPSR